MEARASLVELLYSIERAHRAYQSVVLHAPGHEAGWAPLLDLASLTAEQTQRVVARMDTRRGWDATLPAPSPDLSKNLAQKIRERREARARDHHRSLRLH